MPKAPVQTSAERRVWVAVMRERTTSHLAADSLEKVHMVVGQLGYGKLSLPYMRTDSARNEYVKRFMTNSTSPNDVLVMLDNDHIFDPGIVPKLVSDVTDREGERGVVGCLAFKRGEPFEPCHFIRGDDGMLHSMVYWQDGLYPGEIVGHACVAIARWVFDVLIENGHVAPFWRYEYREEDISSPSEDMYFGRICEESGIRHWADYRLEAPHLIMSTVDRQTWRAYTNDHPELIGKTETIVPVLMSPGGGQ